MIRLDCFRVVLVPVVMLVVSCGPSKREVQQYTIQEFLGTTSFSGASFSPDQSSLLVSSNPTGIFNAHAIPTEGGEAVALTSSTDNSIFALSYFPDDERFLYTSDQGGNELNHIYVQETDGTVRDLTPGQTLKAQFGGWAWDRGSFFILTNERDQRFFDVYECDVDDYSRTMLFTNTQGLNFVDGSPDRSTVLLCRGLLVRGYSQQNRVTISVAAHGPPRRWDRFGSLTARKILWEPGGTEAGAADHR